MEVPDRFQLFRLSFYWSYTLTVTGATSHVLSAHRCRLHCILTNSYKVAPGWKRLAGVGAAKLPANEKTPRVCLSTLHLLLQMFCQPGSVFITVCRCLCVCVWDFFLAGDKQTHTHSQSGCIILVSEASAGGGQSVFWINDQFNFMHHADISPTEPERLMEFHMYARYSGWLYHNAT